MIVVLIGKTLKGVSVVVPVDSQEHKQPSAERLSPSGGLGGETPLYP